MIIDTDRRGSVIWRVVRLLALVPISAGLGHDAIFLAEYGPGDAYQAAMDHSGHGYWPIFGLLIAALALGTVGRDLLRMRQLRMGQLRGHGQPRTATGDGGDGAPRYGRELAIIWPPLFLLTVLFFTVQENLEALGATGHLAGLSPLVGSDHVPAIAILALAGLLVAAAGALLRWRVAVLEHRLARSRVRGPGWRHAADRPAVGWRSIAAICAHRWILVRLDAGRAPPATA